MKKLAAILGLLLCTSAKAATPCGLKESVSTPSMEELITQPFEQLLETRVSSSNKTSTCLSQAPSTISTYSYKDIQHLGARTLSDVLSLVAGVQMQTSSNGRHRLWIRGVQSEFNNKVALYIDNVPMKDAFAGFAIDEELPVESIEKVEIIRGPGSALYGSNAFSGVINIFTTQAGKKGSDGNQMDKRLKNKLKLGIGENSTYSTYATAEQNLADAVDVKLEGKWLDTHGRKPDYDRKGQINSRSNEQELAYLHLSLSALDGELLFNGFYSQFDNSRVDKESSIFNSLTGKNWRFSLSYKHDFSDNLGISLNAYHTDTQRLEHEIDTTRTEAEKKDRLYITRTNLSGLYATLNYHPIESNKIIAGVELKREEEPTSGYISNSNDQFTNSTSVARFQDLAVMTYSLFLQDTQNIFSEKTQFTAGLRYDILDLFDNQFSYRLGLTHDFDNGIYAKLLYGTAYRAPAFVEFTRMELTPQSPNIILPDVETMTTLEGQIGYQTDKVRLSLTGYRNSYKNVLQRSNSFNTKSQALVDRAGDFGNFDHQIIFGSELEAQLKFDKHWTGFVNASWSHAESKDAEQKLPLLADWTVASGLEWREKIYNGDLVFNNQVVVYGKRKDWQDNIWDSGQQQRWPNRSSSLNDGFAIWNSSLHYKIPFAANKQILDFNLTGHNLLNKKYYTQSLISPSAAQNSTAAFDTEYQGRQVRFSVSYSWE